MTSTPRWASAGWVVLALTATGCAETYCQVGAQSGGQCYSGADVHAERRAQGREEPPSEMKPSWNRPRPLPASGSSVSARDGGL